MLANNALMHSTDEGAKQIIASLLNKIQIVRETFAELKDKDTDELTAIILAEEIHFKKAARRNLRARAQQERTRRDHGIIPRTPEAELPRPSVLDRTPIIHSDLQENFIETKEYKEIERQINEKHWPTENTVADPILVAKEVAKEQRENEAIFGTLDINKRAEQELELITKKSNGTRREYAPGRVALLPEDEEINNAGTVNPGEDVL